MTLPEESKYTNFRSALLLKSNLPRLAALTCLLALAGVFTALAVASTPESRDIPLTMPEVERVIVDAFTELKKGYHVTKLESDSNDVILTVTKDRTLYRIIVGFCYGYPAAKRVEPVERRILLSKKKTNNNTYVTKVSLNEKADPDVNGLHFNQFIWDAVDRHLSLTSGVVEKKESR